MLPIECLMSEIPNKSETKAQNIFNRKHKITQTHNYTRKINYRMLMFDLL